MGPVWSLPQIDTLVDVGGGPSVHLSLSEAPSRFLGFFGVGITLNKVVGILPIKEGSLLIQYPFVLFHKLLLDGALLESMYIGDDAEVAKDFDSSQISPGKELVEVKAMKVCVVDEGARGDIRPFSDKGFCVLCDLPHPSIGSPDRWLSLHEPKAHILGWVKLMVFPWDVDVAISFDCPDPGESRVSKVAACNTGCCIGVAITSIFFHVLLITKGVGADVVVWCLGMGNIFSDKK